MEEPKTLSYDWQYGREELFLRVDSYMSDDNLYIGLYHMEDGYPESFAAQALYGRLWGFPAQQGVSLLLR